MTESRPRTPGFVYAALSVVLALVVSVLALSAQQPPPPTIAEFAPQAQEQITEAPEEQASEFGSGPGAECVGDDCPGEEDPTPEPTPEPTPIEVSRVRECVGDPPRQIEDPQAPPCVPYWEGDNGGATAKGVTENEVRIVIPANTMFIPHYESFFNRRFEFYGRKLNLIDMEVGFADSTDDMLAYAVEADREHDVFASTMYGDAQGREYIYYDELADRGIVSVNGRPTSYGEERLRAEHPYQWSYLPGHDVMSSAKAGWACSSLTGETAGFAGGAEVTKPRKYALVMSVPDEGDPPNVDPMVRVLERCGIELAFVERFRSPEGQDDQTFTQARSLISKFQTNDVTTIFCQCHTHDSGYFLGYMATSQGYQPEWLVSTYMYQAEDSHAQAWEPSQVSHTFGLSWWSKQLPPEDSPFWWPVRSYEPGAPANRESLTQARWLYNSLMMLASGIQMAGPNLTPEAFAEGLQAAEFPNPNCGRAPFYQGCVDFSDDHTAIEDAAVIWLSPSQMSNWDGNRGAMCFAADGRRFRDGDWPSDSADLYEPPCY